MKSMFLHDLKVACRSLLKYKLQTVISVVGLAVGLTSFVLCNRVLRNELMWNRRLSDVDNIYFLAPKVYDGYFSIGLKIGKAVKDKFPEIENSVTTMNSGMYTNKMCVVEDEGGKRWREEHFMYSDSNFMSFFDFKLLQGNWDVVKNQPDALILTESAAIRLFGTTDALGKTFMDIDDFFSKEKECTVVGVMPDFPLQTILESSAGLVLNTTDNEILKDDFFNKAGATYFRIRENVSIEDLNKKIESYIKTRPDLFKDELTSIKFYPILERGAYYSKGTHLTFPLIMSGIGLLVLLTAIFNYVMFMSGRILNRQKEYGVRQINGASSKSIFRMFATEISLSICMTVLISLVLIELLARMLTEDVLYYISFDGERNELLILGGYLLEYALFVWGVMMGICWFILKRFRRQTTLQHIQGGGVRYKNRLSNLLLGLQLAICILLSGGSLFVYAQQDFLLENFRGKLSIEECKRIYEFSLAGDKLEPIRTDFQNMVNSNPHIESSCRSGTSLLHPWKLYSKRWEMEGVNNGVDENSANDIDFTYVDANYSEFINARMEEGRFFRVDEPNCAVVNGAFVKHFGINPLGKDITARYSIAQTYRIVGVMDDVIPVSYDTELRPTIYMPYPEGYMNLTYYIKLRPDAKPEVLEPLKAKMQEQVHISTQLRIETLDKQITSRTNDIQEMSNMLLLFASICIIICLLGIYSSMMLAVEKRGREMAIRKINGARLLDIANIFVRHYFVLLGIAALIAFPALYLGVQTWLENYTYRVPITMLPFIAIFVLLFAIVLLTIGSQLLKIMRVNPVEKLKSE